METHSHILATLKRVSNEIHIDSCLPKEVPASAPASINDKQGRPGFFWQRAWNKARNSIPACCFTIIVQKLICGFPPNLNAADCDFNHSSIFAGKNMSCLAYLEYW